MSKLRGQEFTTSGTFTVPADVTSVLVTMVAGGGGGGPSWNFYSGAGGGGGCGEMCAGKELKVTPGDTITVTIGQGGGGGAVGDHKGANGTTTSFGTLSCQGGFGGPVPNPAQVIPTDFPADGGGVSGGKLSGERQDQVAIMGTAESACYFGGSSGGGEPVSVAHQISGGNCAPWAGGGAGAANTFSGGAGGAASVYGPGGSGGNYAAFPSGNNGHSPPGSSFGAGGGGVGGANHSGGSGIQGYCLVQWIA